MNQGKSVYEEYSELNTEPSSDFTRSLKKNDHDDFLQLLKCMQTQWHVIVNARVFSSSRALSSSQLPWIPSGGILMRVNLEDQPIMYLILLAMMISIHLQICVSLLLTFCLTSQWRLYMQVCQTSLSPLPLLFILGWFWSTRSSIWWTYVKFGIQSSMLWHDTKKKDSELCGNYS